MKRSSFFDSVNLSELNTNKIVSQSDEIADEQNIINCFNKFINSLKSEFQQNLLKQ